MAFSLPDLPYAYDALEPVIDAQTMEIHHSKHHQGYVDKANDALKGTPFEGESVETVVARLASMPDEVRTKVRQNAGGHANHSLFWNVMAPKGEGGEASSALKSAIESEFGSMEELKEQFESAATGRFGSGWAWLAVLDGKLHVGSTPNQDNPLMGPDYCEFHGTPILGLDVWEHAYYLKYQNKRPDYVKNFWSIINWEEVSRLYDEAS